MSTICFDIKRCDENHLCIQKGDLNAFEYQEHLPFSFKPYEDPKNDYVEDETYRCVYILIGKNNDYEGAEEILFATNSLGCCIYQKRLKSKIEKWTDLRVQEVPLWIKNGALWAENDLKNQITLYCPEKINEKYHIYASGYKKISEDSEGPPKFEWIPPLPLDNS